MQIEPRRPLDPDTRFLAYASKLSYRTDRERGEYRLKMVQAGIIPNTMKLHQSMKNYIVMYDRTKQLVVIAFRGTKELEDLLPDVSVALMLESMSPRFQDALRIVRSAQSFFGPDTQIVLTGHSLGGSLALYVASKLGLGAAAFNPIATANLADMLGSLIRSVGRVFVPWPRKKNRLQVHHVIGDPISSFSLDLDRKLYKPYFDMNPHTLDQFL